MFGAHSVDSRRLQGGYGQKRGARAVKFPQIHLLTLEVKPEQRLQDTPSKK